MEIPPTDHKAELTSQLERILDDALLSRLVQRVEQIDLRVSEFAEFFRGLSVESDRSLAIVSFAYLDTRLRDAFQAVLNPDIVGGTGQLFDGFGPLSTAGSRIELAAALYWLEPATYRNMRILKKIRNLFAHEPFLLTLEQGALPSLIRAMDAQEHVLLDAIRNHPDGYSIALPLDLRSLLLIRSILTCHRVVVDVAVVPLAHGMGMSGNPLAGLDREQQPKNVASLTEMSARLVAEVLTGGNVVTRREETEEA